MQMYGVFLALILLPFIYAHTRETIELNTYFLPGRLDQKHVDIFSWQLFLLNLGKQSLLSPTGEIVYDEAHEKAHVLEEVIAM